MHKYTSKAGRGREGVERWRGGEGTKEPNLQGHLSKIENVNNETRGRRIHNLECEM